MQVESLIKLLTETLKFYAEESNYSERIHQDGGFQARHTLKLIQDNEKSMQSFEKLYEEFQEKVDSKTSADDVLKMINELKKT
jgi:hypothetical protein